MEFGEPSTAPVSSHLPAQAVFGEITPGFGIACRSCGAPCSVESSSACEYCGSEQPHDAATLLRLAAHRARMRRALQQLRAVLGTQVQQAADAGWAWKLALIYLFVPIPIMLLSIALPMGAVFAATAAFGRAIPQFFVMLALAVAVFGGGGLGLFLALSIPYRMLKRHAVDVRRQAREILAEVDATQPVACPSCGGHAVVVALGAEEAVPCPWCSGAVLPPASFESITQSLAEALRRRDPRLAERFVRNLGRTIGARRLVPRLAGYELVGGGAVAAGSTAGVPLRAFNEIVDGSFVQRVEASFPTLVEDDVWLVRAEVEPLLRRLAAEWGYSMPEAAVAAPRPGWSGYVRRGSLPSTPAIGDALDRLGSNAAVLIDPAGVSLWRKASGLSRSWGLLEEHHATVAALANALRSRP
jgi:hypothetical protein